MNTIYLQLDAPMQSWGHRSHWTVRDTASIPTKSGIAGLLARCAGTFDADGIKAICQQIPEMGVAVLNPGSIETDYHTISGSLMSNGKPKFLDDKPITTESYRYYLSGATFVVAIRAGVKFINRLKEWLEAPIFPPFLGRAAFVPSCPILHSIGASDNMQDAMAKFPACEYWIECTPQECDVVLQDEILVTYRSYLPRYLRRLPGKAVN